jgi:hypothetical protein
METSTYFKLSITATFLKKYKLYAIFYSEGRKEAEQTQEMQTIKVKLSP